jgi:N-acyl-L-homoserine lactone synthetase
MIHVVTSINATLYRDALAEMHALRKQHFVDERGWKLDVIDGGEYDCYDDARAVYFLALSSEGWVEVSIRARSADDRCLLTDVFPHMIDPKEEPLNAPGVWELTRYFAVSAARGRSGKKRRAELRLAVLKYVRGRGAHKLVSMTDTYFLPPLLRCGWTVRLLGPPSPYPEGEAIAFEIDCTLEGIARMRETNGLDGRYLLEVSPDLDLPPLPPHELELLLTANKGLSADEA